MREQVIMAATEDGWAPRSDVAALVGVSVSALRRWIEAGDVRAERRGSVRFVSVQDAERRAGKYEAEEATHGGGPAARALPELSGERGEAIAASGVPPSQAAAMLGGVRKQVRDGQKQSPQEGASSAAS